MLSAVKHSKEMEIREFICFLSAFHNYLTIPRNIFGEIKTPGFSTAQKSGWLSVFLKYAKLVGIPEDMVGHLQTAVEKKDKHLLDWVLTQSREALYSMVSK
jgi:hypothetical protein